MRQEFKPLINKFIEKVQGSFGKNFLAGALFGSIAREQEKPTSDIDLLLIFSRKDAGLEETITNLLVEADSWPEKQSLVAKGFFGGISALIRTKQELIENPLILLDVMEEGIVLYDPHETLQNLFFRLRKKLKELNAKKVVLPDGTWYWDLKPDWKPGEVVEVTL